MGYYHDLITDQSWKELQKLRRRYDFILLGGWAVFLYTKQLKSKDIDILCSYETLEKFRMAYDLVKNDRLKKYEIHRETFDVDIYVPFFSDLGIPAEDLQKMQQSVEGFSVLAPEALLILKQKAYADRRQSVKGEKDKLDILALILAGVDFEKYKELLRRYKLPAYRDDLVRLITATRSAPELNMSEHAIARRKKIWLAALGKI